jgi:hypothetical protein
LGAVVFDAVDGCAGHGVPKPRGLEFLDSRFID